MFLASLKSWTTMVHLQKTFLGMIICDTLKLLISWNPIEHTDSQPCTRPPSWGHDGTWGTRGESAILNRATLITNNNHNVNYQPNDCMNLMSRLEVLQKHAKVSHGRN
jgi:hypothetical protein